MDKIGRAGQDSRECPCAYREDPEKPCICAYAERTRCAARLRGPLLNRLDLIVRAPRLTVGGLSRAPQPRGVTHARLTGRTRHRSTGPVPAQACAPRRWSRRVSARRCPAASADRVGP
nr:ATP-binding protein [Deinococcus hopiensis]